MSAKNEQSADPKLFEATISIDLEARQRLETLDIDVIGEYFDCYGEHLPAALREEQQRVAAELKAAALEKAS